MELTILGCHSATPRANARPTAQILETKGHLFLIDCGEGTQVALRNHSIQFSRIKHIFISHLHGDHFYGLPGLISTFQLLGRQTELHIYAPQGIKETLTILFKYSGLRVSFPLHFHELKSKEKELIFEDEKITIHTIALQHRIYTNGFLFEEKLGERRLNMQAIFQNNIQKCDYQNIKNGKDIKVDNGSLIPNTELSYDPLLPMSYAFCSDTLYFPELATQIEGVRMLYHESTFLENNQELAQKTMHSTAYQAAMTARNAGVEMLILGHYSSRYSDKNMFAEEAKKVFSNVFLATEGKVFRMT